MFFLHVKKLLFRAKESESEARIYCHSAGIMKSGCAIRFSYCHPAGHRQAQGFQFLGGINRARV